jgi:hypothetical protein
MMGTWFWLNFPLAGLILCCWAGIPLWLTLTRRHAETAASHAEIAARAAAEQVMVPSHPALAGGRGTVGPVYERLTDLRGR